MCREANADAADAMRLNFSPTEPIVLYGIVSLRYATNCQTPPQASRHPTATQPFRRDHSAASQQRPSLIVFSDTTGPESRGLQARQLQYPARARATYRPHPQRVALAPAARTRGQGTNNDAEQPPAVAPTYGTLRGST